MRLEKLGTPELRKLEKLCAGRDLVILHPSLCRVLKLTYPTDIGSIFKDSRITNEIETGSLGQSVGILSAADFWPVCE